jgi:hypothetical protein
LEYDEITGRPSEGVEGEVDSKDGETAVSTLDHTRAMLQIMMGRAAAALSVTPMIEKVSAAGENYHMTTTKMSSALQAFLRLARENHRYLMGVPRFVDKAPQAPVSSFSRSNEKRYEYQNEEAQGIADIMQPLFEKTEGVVEEALADQARYHAQEEEKKKELTTKDTKFTKEMQKKKL